MVAAVDYGVRRSRCTVQGRPVLASQGQASQGQASQSQASRLIVRATPGRVLPMNDVLDQELRQLIEAILALPEGAAARRRLVNRFCLRVQQSRKLWGAPGVSPELYAEALSGLWLYVLKNFHKYEADRGAVLTWMNNRLKWDLKTLQSTAWTELQRRMQDFAIDGGEGSTWADRLRAEPDSQLMLEGMCKAWWEARAMTQSVHVKGKPAINCYELFQDMLGLSCEPAQWLVRRDRDTYRAMSAHYGAPIPTLASFWTNRCVPQVRVVLQDFGSAGP
ncbi:MAG: hypothetical protein RLZZ511_1631 [Cyanobacteriota bacterium]